MVFIVQIINAADILIYHKKPCNSINCMAFHVKFMLVPSLR